MPDPYIPVTQPPPPTNTGYGAVPTYQLGAQPTSDGGAPVGGGPNLLGMGMYQGAPINVNQGAFNNSVGVQAGQALSGEIGNYLGNTTQPVVAQQAGYAPNAAYTSGINQQQALANQYGQQAAGNGPSLATQTANVQGQNNLAQAESMLGSARGAGNPAAAQQAAMNARATGQQQVAQNAVMGRTQEEMNAMNAQAGLLGNISNQGLQQQGLQQQTNQFNAGQANQVGMGNQQNTLNANNGYMNQLGQINSQQQQGQIQGQQLAAQTALGQQNIENQAYNNAAQNNAKAVGSIMQGASGLAAQVGSGGLSSFFM